MNTTPYEKLLATLRHQLIGLGKQDPVFYQCVKALDWAKNVHDGTRKDGKTREFYHQLNILGFLMTQHGHLKQACLVYLVAILHDTYEDYPERSQEIEELFPSVMPYLVRISKIRNGHAVPYDAYYGEMAQCCVCSVVKAVDRIHNLSSMVNVFPQEKQLTYAEEVDQFFLPMLKTARRLFPAQEQVYETLKSVLNLQTTMVNGYLGHSS